MSVHNQLVLLQACSLAHNFAKTHVCVMCVCVRALHSPCELVDLTFGNHAVCTGVWLLARCADLQAMHYDVTMFWTTIRVLGYIGLGFRLLASMSLLLLNRNKQL